MRKDWIFVLLTSLIEIVWLLGFQFATAWWHWVLIIGLIGLDFHFLSKACENLPTGTVYAVFAGAGTLGTVLLDTFWFERPLDFATIGFMLILLTGIIGLKISDSLPTEKTEKV
ncbi:DMT family transporter [Lysinibacillus sp. 3P01SB]|uniref:DMT family transporter n=1 Tax=Lysinibacillus sp. 3P01SB TaxID=3132284 RepID=UPI0039A6DB9B